MSVSSRAARRLGVAAIAAACAATPASGTAAAASVQPQSVSTTSNTKISDAAWAAGRAKHGPGATAQQALDAFWTPERMRNARPIEETAAYADDMARGERLASAARRDAASGATRPAPRGAPFTVPPGQPRTTTFRRSAYNPNYNTWDPAAHTNGKVFFSTPTGTAQCSGAIVMTEGRNSVWTAAHCVHGGPGGSWYSNWTFVPAYDDDLANPRPFGTWWSRQLTVRTAWITNRDQSEDMAVSTMWASSAGTRIADYFGGQGFAVNLGKTVWENAFGYPGVAPFDGGNLLRCWGTAAPEWTSGSTTSETITIPCDLNQGASGGPWLYGFNGAHGYLNGINSRGDRLPNPTRVITPYFDGSALSLYNDTRYR